MVSSSNSFESLALAQSTRLAFAVACAVIVVCIVVLSLLIALLYLGSSTLARLGKQTEDQRTARAHFYSFLFLLLTFCVLVGCSSTVFLFLKVFSSFLARSRFTMFAF